MIVEITEASDIAVRLSHSAPVQSLLQITGKWSSGKKTTARKTFAGSTLETMADISVIRGANC